jgi:flagellar biosynthesis GTPase FlhF
MSVYSKIFASTSKRFASAVSSGRQYPPGIVWGLPGFVGFTWIIWGGLTEDIRSSVGLYWDPDAIIHRVEAERFQRLEAKAAAKAANKPASESEEEEEDEEEGTVTAEDIEAAVNSAIEQSGEADDEDEDASEPAKEEDPQEEEEEEKEEVNEEEKEEEEEEEEEKPKKIKVNVDELTTEEKWDHWAARFTIPGEDDVSSMYFVHYQ